MAKSRKKGLRLGLGKIGVNLNHIFEDMLAIGLAVAAGAIIFKIAQSHFGFFSYGGMSRNQVLQVARAVDARLPILSRACERPNPFDNRDYFCRGIYLPSNGEMVYYRLEDNVSDNSAHYELYKVPAEMWTTNPSLSPFPSGTITDIGDEVTTNISSNPQRPPRSGTGYGVSRYYNQGVGALHQY